MKKSGAWNGIKLDDNMVKKRFYILHFPEKPNEDK